MEIKNGKINILPMLPKLADFFVMKYAPVGFLYSKDRHALTILWKILDKKQIMVENWIMKSKIIISEQEKQLIPAAFNMLKYSYSPYSNFKVGAALLSSTGKIFGGCNIGIFLGGNCLCRADCNFQSGEWRWKIVFSNLHRWRQKWWCSGFLFSVRNLPTGSFRIL